MLLNKVENYVRDLFTEKSKAENLYHSILHTTEVVGVAERIGYAEAISSSDMEILLIACWFHDTGHFHCCHGHEDQSAEYARAYFKNEFYPNDSIEKVVGCIKATQVPQNPKNLLEKIICDADLHHLGEKDIKERGDLLRQEFELREIKKLSDIEWLTFSIEFFNNHHFFTDYAKEHYGIQKDINIERMKKKLEELIKNRDSNN
ncbi:MAG: HD domain-containing protein [Ignavibacteria bacterium]|nr:HD domain-containing protein [Ignavibacteria bacterium]